MATVVELGPHPGEGTPLTIRLKEKWSALTDADLEGIAGEKDRLAGKLRERYGYGKEQAEQEAEEFLRVHPRPNGNGSLPTGEPVPVPALPDGGLPPGRPKAEPLPAPGYLHSVTVWVSPRALRWVAPAMVVGLVVFLFLPWTGAYPGGYGVYTQNAFQTVWGGVSVDPVGAKELGFVKPYDNVGADRLMLPYTLLILLALVLVLAPLARTPARVAALPPIVRSLWRGRLELLTGVALTAFLLLLIQLWTGFGLETAAAAHVDKNLAGEFAAAQTPEGQKMANIHRGLQLGPFNFGRTLWLRLAVLSHVLLLTGLGLELWIKRRGPRPLPRIDLQA